MTFFSGLLAGSHNQVLPCLLQALSRALVFSDSHANICVSEIGVSEVYLMPSSIGIPS